MERFFFFTAIILWAAAFTFFMIRRRGRANEAHMEDFNETERAANSARRKDIDPSLFFTPRLEDLPVEHGDSKAYADVKKLAERKMIRFETPVTNTELKLAYGPSQLEDIAQMEEHFNQFIRALIEWAEEIIENERKADALRILEYTLGLGSEFLKSYTLTADIYAASSSLDKLDELYAAAERKPFKDDSIRRRILQYIMEVKDGIQ
jgi:hypothetical protein